MLCQRFARLRDPRRADLHTHTTFSDGTLTPAALVERAVLAGLRAFAVTDHDTTAGVGSAQAAAQGRLEVIAGVELTSEFRGTELHLLGYFVRVDDGPLTVALDKLRSTRRERILEMARRLRPLGASVEDDVLALPEEVSLGRRHLAGILIARGYSQSRHHAFTRWLANPALVSVSKRRLPVADAIDLVRGAGGVASWAHPPTDADLEALSALRDMGLQAVECVYPWPTGARGKRLRAMAESLGLAVTGGSDYHGPSPATRAVGARTVSLEELDRIRSLSGQWSVVSGQPAGSPPPGVPLTTDH
ncbi:MAG TPA: PHP domain-containing protein [Gemmataceae bacterium]|nr:PHP domain-containing protein [Gemmataceae bacterium]